MDEFVLRDAFYLNADDDFSLPRIAPDSKYRLIYDLKLDRARLKYAVRLPPLDYGEGKTRQQDSDDSVIALSFVFWFALVSTVVYTTLLVYLFVLR